MTHLIPRKSVLKFRNSEVPFYDFVGARKGMNFGAISIKNIPAESVQEKRQKKAKFNRRVSTISSTFKETKDSRMKRFKS